MIFKNILLALNFWYYLMSVCMLFKCHFAVNFSEKCQNYIKESCLLLVNPVGRFRGKTDIHGGYRLRKKASESKWS